MTTPQQPIASGLTATSTASDAIDGIDLTGKLALVTGGYSGIGLETTRVLANAGAHVVVPARRTEAAKQALDGLDVAGGVELAALDLSDLDSVRSFAETFLAAGRGIDLLINSAGIMACPETRVGPGWEAQFATNHLGHFALVNRLWPAVARDARIVSVSSRGHQFSPVRWDDLHFERGYDKWLAYGQAKTANVLFAVHLDAIANGPRAFSLHPGAIRTNLGRHLTAQDFADLGAGDDDGEFAWKSIPEGAATQVWAATSPRLAGLGGVYCEDCDIAELTTASPGPPRVTSGVCDYAIDPAQAARLWELSAELTGVNAFA